MMQHNHYSSDMAAKCLKLIKEQGPILAISLADQLAIVGDRENKRRRIRAIVKHLRNDCGELIIGDFLSGYTLTKDLKIWQEYLDSRQFGAKKILAVTHKQLNMVRDSNGQGLLFVSGVGELNNKQFQNKELVNA